ncbi:MAG: hypothetical protein N2111_11985 [Candidatus Sumerlaeaceae bacterium]|nr:hypothetical protein [Candidatus Sumerlaeaceae bacterium]
MRGVRASRSWLFVIGIFPVRVWAATLTVTTPADSVVVDGQISLREAVTAASTNLPSGDAPAGSPGYDVIRFAPSLTAGGPVTITLVGPGLVVSDETEIIGPGRSRLAISGNNTVRPFQVTSFTSASLGGLTIRDGMTPPLHSGGGILGESDSLLTLRDCRLTSNTARRGGGGISAQTRAVLTLTDCQVDGNLGEESGGGVEFFGSASGSLIRCVIQNNRTGTLSSAIGGGVTWLVTPTGLMTDCVVADNRVPNSAGGGMFARNSHVMVERTTFSGNRAGQLPGGLGDGGGLFADNTTTISLINCTISGNSADDSGGGIAWQALAGSLLKLENCTLANNTADSDANGAGTGGGIHRTGGTVLLTNTIVAGNTDRTTLRPDISGTITSLGYNLIGSLGTQAFGSNTAGDRYGDPGNTTTPNSGAIESATTISAVLGALAHNGGYGFTHLPGMGSPALNNANPATTETVDQRGVSRPSGAGYDIGSVEVGGCAANPVVTTTADSGGGSLRDAIALACPGAVITFLPSLTEFGSTTITLTSGELLVNKRLTIEGPGRDLISVSGNGASRVMSVTSGPVTLKSLTFRDGFLTGGADGAGLWVATGTSVVIEKCAITDCVATGSLGAVGGGLFVDGTGTGVTLVECYVGRNKASGVGGGMAFAFNTAGLISSTTLHDNLAERPVTFGGGGLYVEGATVSIRNSTLSGNRAFENGGAIMTNSASTLVSLENATLTANRCDIDGINAGQGGGIHRANGTVLMANTIVAGNVDFGNQAPDISGAITSLGYNLVGHVGVTNFSSNRAGDRYGDPYNTTTPNAGAIESATAIDPRLGPLASIGGPALIHVPMAASPAVDNAAPATTATMDQRRVSRPQGVRADIGSVEFRPSILQWSVDSRFYPNGGTFDFGPCLVGQPVQKTVVVTNVGDEVVTPTGLTIGGLPEFTVPQNSWFPGLLQPDQSVQQGMTFTPSSRASFSGLLRFAYENSSFTLNLAGRGCQPAMVVTNLNDAGAGSLRQAVQEVCSEGTISFAPSLTAGGPTTLTLTSGEISIPASVTIVGPGRDRLTVSGGSQSRVFRYDSSTSVTIRDLTLSQGGTPDHGGAISAGGPLTLIGCHIHDSWAGLDGGGVRALKNVSIVDSKFSSCFAGDRGGGLAVFGSANTVVLDRVVFDTNEASTYVYSSGGGANIRNVASVQMFDCQFNSNYARGPAGGLSLADVGNALVDRTLFWMNQSYGGEGGGGLYSEDSSVLVRNCTFASNRSRTDGGGLFSGGATGRVTVENCTLWDNQCNADGVGSDDGGGVMQNGSNQLWLANTIVAGNQDPDGNRPDIAGIVRSSGYNLIGTVGTQPFIFNTTGDRYGDPFNTTTPNPGAFESASVINAQVGPLNYYGGPTPTLNLLANSLALNRGDPATTVTVDQRGVARPIQNGFDIGAVERATYVNHQCQNFTTNQLTAPGSSTGWSSSGFNSALAFVDYSLTETAIRLYVAPSADRFRIAGVLSNFSEWLPYTNIGPGNIVRGKFYLFAGGQPNPSDRNQIPNLRMRLSCRFAVNSMLEVFHHDPNEGDAGQIRRYSEMRPTTWEFSPSLYRVDFDVIDVPYLQANAAGEGVLRGVEAYAIYPSDQGYLALTEACIGTYPAPLVTPLSPLSRRYETASGGAGSLAAFYPASEINLFNLIPGTTEGAFGTVETVGSLPTYSEGAGGITLASLAVPTNRIGVAAREINIDGSASANLQTRPRVSADTQYSIRWHLTSTQQVNRQAQIRLRARTNKFGWSQKFEIGGAWGTGGGLYPLNANNSIAQQSLPGVGCQNPDQRTPGEPGGWYHMIMHTPLSSDIRAEHPPGTPITTTMPHLSSQPGPGVNSASRRDLFLGLDLVDTISGGNGRFLEAGHVTLDATEIRWQALVDD